MSNHFQRREEEGARHQSRMPRTADQLEVARDMQRAVTKVLAVFSALVFGWHWREDR